jgi:predicted regulator of Ras-like GTPase activity (Roadblock/LC7/MglB family)
MTIPFLDIFKKWTGRIRPAQTSAASTAARSFIPSPTKAAGERLSKTVMPNTTRSTSSDFFKDAGDSAPTIRAAAQRSLPPTVALALQPKVERAISLQLSDLVERVPAGFLKPAESYDIAQTILLKASEIEKGMADGKPAVSLFSIYEQVPDIFLRTVRPDDAMQVSVPHEKVLDQLRKMQVRDDQDSDSTVPQLDTPILKVALEDTQRFGTKTPTTQTSANPRVKVEPPTARAFSNAEPEVAVSEKFTPPPASVPGNLTTSPQIAPRPSAPDPVSPTRIPFKLPPKGAGEPVSEKVPASSGSSVPPSVPVSTSAARIPFKMTPPSEDLKPKLRLVPGVTAAETSEKKAQATAVPAGAKVSLGLRAVVQNMPSFQLHRSADSVAADAHVELPLALVESQLSSGRIAVPIKLFHEALPADYKELLVIDAAESPVLLPLQEVLKNLSPDLLKMRDDQVADELAHGFETPFSIKAAEDAKRFSAPPEEETAPSAIAPVVEAAKTPEAKQPEVLKTPEVKTPEVAKAPEAKPVEVAKIPEAKQAEKAIEAKPPEVAKAPEVKPVEAAKIAEVKQPDKAIEVKALDVKPAEAAKTPEAEQPAIPKPAPETPAVVSEPLRFEKTPVLRFPVPPPAGKAAPITAVKLPVETKPETTVQAATPPKIEPKAEVKTDPGLKLKIEAPNELKPRSVGVPEKPAAKTEQKPEVNTNAKAVVEQANAMPGVAGSTVIFEDGLSLAGNLPDEVQAGGLCAMAPSILQKLNRHTIDTKFGPLVSMTLSWRDAQLSFFMTGTVCLAVLHSQPVLPAETHRQLAAKTTELSRIYAQPGEKHVNH